MKTPYLYALTAVAGISLFVLSSCNFNCVKGSGNQTSETRKVGEFTKIDISGGFKIKLKQDSSGSVSITGDDNLLKYIKTAVHGNQLRISTGKKNLCFDHQMVITIGVRNIDAIEASGAVEITNDGKLVTKDLSFDLSGATKINMDIDAAKVTTEGSGATEIYLKGQASSHSIELSGSGKVHAFDFIVGSYSISTSGATESEINVLNDLDVHTTGASSIKYKGNPAHINNDKTGASSITKVD
jgi:hypothetical protein